MTATLPLYRIFYITALTGNISKAADQLFISQPAISRSIQKLEQALGVPLFTRSSRGVHMTPEGEILFRHAETAFQALNSGEEELKRIREFNIGHLRIGVSNTLCKYILLPYLKKFIEQYPHIKITIEGQATARTISMLEQHTLDIGLVAEPAGLSGLSFIPVMEIQDVFVSTRHYLNNLYLREGKDSDLFQCGNIMLLDQNNMTRHHVDEYMEEHRIIPKQILEVTTMDLLIEFAKISLGVACVIRELVQKELESGRLIQIPLPAPIKKRTIGFAFWGGSQSRALKTFLEFLY